MKKYEEIRKEKLQELKEILKKGVRKDSNKNVMLTYNIIRVSNSGMSRVIDVFVETKEGIVNINRYIQVINGEQFTNDYHIRIYGCGMDMLFNTSYTLNQEAKYLDNYKGKKKDNYNYIVSTYYNRI